MVQTIKAMKRFGSRYGRKLKERFGEIEREQRKKQLCPFCRAPQVKRVALGIWNCRKCNVKFTGKAYSVEKRISFKKQPEESRQELQEEEQAQEAAAL
ncbi:hypothetical protein HYV84_00465 [Candidatus Woesearchaeota archaeon]|nr:hypothetical protein [Candidatus Woesearchaeota archaeon]